MVQNRLKPPIGQGAGNAEKDAKLSFGESIVNLFGRFF
jgi:hypothetical protein